MLNTECVATYWKNIKNMPFLLRMFCYGAIVGIPALIFLLFLVPSAVWDINGRTMSSAELWSSGRGNAIAASLPLFIFSIWGLVARKNRWIVIFSPFAPGIVLAVLPSGSIDFVEVVNAALSALMLYVFFFHIRAVREYFDCNDVDK